MIMINFHMSEAFWRSELKKNPCMQAGANLTSARAWVGHAAYIDFFYSYWTTFMYLY